MSKVFVIAGTFEQFRMFREQLVYTMSVEDIPVKYHDIVYVSGPDQLRGYREPWGYMVGTWYNRQDIGELETLIKTAGSTLEDFIEVKL